MPIPRRVDINRAIEEANISGGRAPIDKLLKSEPYNFHREIEFSWIDFNPRSGALEHRIIAKAIRFNCPCDPEIGSKLSYLQLRPTGLIHTCIGCRRTEWVGSFENCEVLNTRRISIEEAYLIMEKSGQMCPIGFPERGEKIMKFIL